MTTQTAQTSALAAAQNDCEVANRLVKQYSSRKANGGPSNPANGAVAFTSAEYLAALASINAGNQAILDAIVAANPQS